MRITILVGTMTGTAQLCAQEMELALEDGETQIEALLMDGLESSVFAFSWWLLQGCAFSLPNSSGPAEGWRRVWRI